MNIPLFSRSRLLSANLQSKFAIFPFNSMLILDLGSSHVVGFITETAGFISKFNIFPRPKVSINEQNILSRSKGRDPPEI